MIPKPTYSKSDLFAWARNIAPDLRIVYTRVEGKIATDACLTLGDELVRLEEDDDPDGEKIVRAVVEAIRDRMRLPPLFSGSADRRRELERQIVVARLSGSDEEADLLTREMLFSCPRRDHPAIVATRLSSRKT